MAERTAPDYAPAKLELEKQQHDLDNYVPLDPAKGRYGTPINKAMEETLQEQKQSSPATAAISWLDLIPEF
ncbi:MAG: hypothetical protein R3C11_05225 [Planctomycetaceae bacterium]